MNDYERTTRALTLATVPEPLLGAQRGTTALVARLDDVHTEDLPGIGDQGVSINGFPVSAAGGGTGRGSFFVGLGPPEGEAAHAALESAIRAAKA